MPQYSTAAETAKMASMGEHQYKSANQSGHTVHPIRKRMPGYHLFDFFRPGWFIVGVLFLPMLLILTWAVGGVLHLLGLL